MNSHISSAQFVIEKNIPIPEVRGAGRRPICPFGEMGVGDSFAVRGDRKRQMRISSAAVDYGKRHGSKFSVRRMDAETFRVWRIA